MKTIRILLLLAICSTWFSYPVLIRAIRKEIVCYRHSLCRLRKLEKVNDGFQAKLSEAEEYLQEKKSLVDNCESQIDILDRGIVTLRNWLSVSGRKESDEFEYKGKYYSYQVVITDLGSRVLEASNLRMERGMHLNLIAKMESLLCEWDEVDTLLQIKIEEAKDRCGMALYLRDFGIWSPDCRIFFNYL